LSGIGLIFLGIRLFIHKKKFKEEKKTNKIILGILLFIIGIFILISYGISIIMTIVSYNLEAVFHTIPILLLPFLIGIVLIMISKYSIKSTNTTQERKRKFILSLLMGLFILCISSLSIISMINVPYYYVFYTPFYPIFFFVIGIVLIIYSYKFQQIMGKRKLETQIKS
jgi:peptidoglycan/LPS O-acetylase OafA/YrhL